MDRVAACIAGARVRDFLIVVRFPTGSGRWWYHGVSFDTREEADAYVERPNALRDRDMRSMTFAELRAANAKSSPRESNVDHGQAEA